MQMREAIANFVPSRLWLLALKLQSKMSTSVTKLIVEVSSQLIFFANDGLPRLEGTLTKQRL